MSPDMTPSPIACRAGGKRKRRVGTTPSANTATDKWLALAIIMNELGKDEDDDNDGDENDDDDNDDVQYNDEDNDDEDADDNDGDDDDEDEDDKGGDHDERAALM